MSTEDTSLNSPEIPRLARVLEPGQTYASVTDKISSIVLTRPISLGWLLGFGLAFTLMMVMLASIAWLFTKGVGIWGNNIPVGWGWDITNFVWWIGIGHAGTLISAILLLLNQKWRTSINRFAEAMTLFAVMCAGMFPLLHMGRPWFAYWMFPYPNTMQVQPQFRSPLIWDVFAVSTYFTVSLLFWFTGLIPDLATLRDRAVTKVRQWVFGALSLGWRGSARHWRNYEAAYLILAGLSTPLVLSVHSIVSMDFATSVIPGWHTTIFPPYFVAGAVFSGFAMVLTLLLITRKVFHLEDYITIYHVELMNIIIIITGSIVGIAYITEFFIAWYGQVPAEQYAFINRATGPYWWAYWSMMTCNVISPQLFWFKKIRTNLVSTFILSIIVNIGMWFERFVIIVTSLHRDYVPSSWSMFHPTMYDIGQYIFTFGLFFTAFFLFAKFFPVINMAEVKSIVKATSEKKH